MKKISKYMMATTAFHKLGPISREDITDIDVSENLCYVNQESETDYYGSWITGLGFMEVRFPKETTRDLTPEEIEKCNKLRIRISDQPSHKLKVD